MNLQGFSAASFFAFWNAESLEAHPTTPKLKYRIIGGYKFQFQLLDYRSRTRLGLRVVNLTKEIAPLLKRAQGLREEPADASVAEKQAVEEFNTSMMMDLIPEVLGLLAVEGVQALMDDFNSTVKVDRGQGTFEALSNMNVAEEVFGKDITLQLPVAITAAEVNLEGFSNRIVDALR